MEIRLKLLKTTSECDSMRIVPLLEPRVLLIKNLKKSRFTFGYQPVTVLFDFAIVFGNSWAPTFSL